MDAQSDLPQFSFWISVPLMCLSAVLLARLIASVVRLVRQARILSVPLAARSEIEFYETGRVVLCVEGPRFTSRFAGLSYELSTASGFPVESRPSLFHATTSGISTVRMEMRSCQIPHPGRYVLRIDGLGAPRERDAEHRIVFARPHLAQTVAHVIGMILAGGLFILGLVIFAWRLIPKGSNP